ncbi:hypothetical protein F845_gp57 [Enterobacteria phage HK225]|uniref:hypothetical protein n=1 Tax=Enterobacteria phage HK225 TaxID=1147144 RepID=UPI00029D2483|nr:hypothetical protein F845_gp57 [Enterobacteria phage HK225]AFH20369.1 hypothetical protein HK225_058 [Enterobacteria phage HK225]
MTKLTKERLEEIAELARKATYKPCAMHMTNLLVVCDSEVIEEMARQLLASMEQEPVSYTCSDALDDVYCGSAAMMGPAGAVGEVPLYAAPQLPQPAVLSVSEGVLKSLLPDVEKSEFWFEHNGKIFFEGVRFNNAVFEACRAAMLQAEPVSNSDELPLDYLQGHKDGLEWAAQLAEANHPQTGDWLYDDPIDLARAIRKGPDMPTVQGGNSPVIPDDVRRMDWLVSKTVDVREPMVYGSHSLFWSQTITDEEDDYHATKLREQIDAAMAAEQAAAPQQEAE